MNCKIVRRRAAAEYVGLSVACMDKMRISGTGPVFVRLGSRAVGYEISALEDWVAKRRRASTSHDPAQPQGHR